MRAPVYPSTLWVGGRAGHGGGGKLKRSCLIAEIWSVRSVALLALCVYRELFKFYHTYLVCGFYLSGCAKLEDPLSRAQQLYKWSSIYHIVWLFVVIIVIIISIIVGVVCGVRVLVLVLLKLIRVCDKNEKGASYSRLCGLSELKV